MSVPKGAYFPRQYLLDLFRYLARRRDRYQIITYSDLCWTETERYPSDYRLEFERWKLKHGKSSRIHILLQHDVDSHPERTNAILRYQEEIAVPSNVMVFSRRIDRKRLKRDGVVTETDYGIDHDRLSKLERDKGFVVGYHCNAVERARGDDAGAQELFREDVKNLRRYYTIRFFSPHGGVPTPDGRNNTSIEVPPELRGELIWVHNRFSAIFNGTYSDGGINNPRRDPDPRNLIDFVRRLKPGNRYRILIHPQYYDVAFREAPVLQRSPWYREVLHHYRTSADVSLWEEVLG